jgi:putative transposase
MPRRPRLRLAGTPFHVIQRGHNRSACFFAERDYQHYLRELLLQARHHRVAIHAYVLMTNHVHLLMTPAREDGIGHVMKGVGQSHSRYINTNRGRSGTLWQGRFRSCLVDSEDYLLRCHQYIETNPVRAGMVEHPGQYPWSSYGFNAQGAANVLLTPHPSVEALGRNPEERRLAYRELFLHTLDARLLAEIRDATQGGHALGSDRFRDSIASSVGRPVTPLKRGPKIKSLSPIRARSRS